MACVLDREDIQQQADDKSHGDPDDRVGRRVPVAHHGCDRRQLRAEEHRRSVEVRPAKGKPNRWIDVSISKLEDTPSDRQERHQLRHGHVDGPDKETRVESIGQEDGKRSCPRQARANANEQTGPDAAADCHELDMARLQPSLRVSILGILHGRVRKGNLFLSSCWLLNGFQLLDFHGQYSLI